jgi:hypothetical protein
MWGETCCYCLNVKWHIVNTGNVGVIGGSERIGKKCWLG